MTPFEWLFVAHLVGDMILGQTEYEALNKTTKWWPCLRHAAKWTLIVAAASWCAGWRGGFSYGALVLLMGALHAVIDRRWPIKAMLRCVKGSKNPQPWLVMWEDQIVHVVQIAVLAVVLSGVR